MKNMRDLLPEKYWDNVKDGKLVSEKWIVETSSKYYDEDWNSHWISSYYADEKPEEFTVLQEFLTSLNPEFTYKQYLGYKKKYRTLEDAKKDPNASRCSIYMCKIDNIDFKVKKVKVV